MRRGYRWAVVLATVAAACGEAPRPDTLPVQARSTAERVHVDPQPEMQALRLDVDIQALSTAYLTAYEIDDKEARRTAMSAADDAIVAAGADGARALLVAWSKADVFNDCDLLVRIGADAVEPVLERLADPRAPGSQELVSALGELADHWHRWEGSELGQRVAERFLAVAQAYDGGALDGPRTRDEVRADEERGSAAIEALMQFGYYPELAAPYAKDIARLLAAWWKLEADAGQEKAFETLMQLGTAAAPALPILFAANDGSDNAADDDESYLKSTLELATRVGAASPETLPDLLVATESEDPWIRIVATQALSTWGNGFPEIRARLVALLDDPDADVRDASAQALAESGANVPLVWRYLLRSAADSSFRVDKERAILGSAVRNAQLGDDIVSALPSLSSDELRGLARLAGDWTLEFESAVMSHLVTHADPDVRATTLSVWSRWPEAPPAGRTLLRDRDERVRVATAIALTRETNGALRDESRGVLVAALASRDDEVVDDAVRALADDELPIAGVPSNVVRELAAHLTDDRQSAGRQADVLVRCEGGVAELDRVLRPTLGAEFDPDGEGGAVVAALEGAGEHAAVLRDAVAATTAAQAGRYHDNLQRVLLTIDGDAISYAASAPYHTPSVALRLLAMGPDGPRAAVLLYGIDRDDRPWGDWQDPPLLGVTDPRLDAAVGEAARKRDGEHATALRRGAARMLSRLPASQAVPLLVELAHDADVGIRRDAVRSLGRVEERSPGSVPTGAVRAALRDPVTCRDALAVIRRMGSYAGGLAGDVRTVARDGWPAARLEAAVLLPRWGDDAERVVDLLTEILDDASSAPASDHPLWAVDNTDVWDDVCATFLAAPPRQSHVDLFLRAGSIPARSYLKVFAHLGPRAAPAVPHLRGLLTDFFGACGNVDWTYGETDSFAEAIARTAVAIGPAARPLTADLRRRAAQRGDPNGVLRDAIRQLEAGR